MKEVKQKRRRNAAVLSMIQRGVTPSIFPKIMRLKKAKEAWKVLKQEFQGDVKVREIKLQTLRRDYENTKMKENESLNDYSSRLTDLINQMKSYGDEFEDQRIVEKILISIPEKFDPIIGSQNFGPCLILLDVFDDVKNTCEELDDTQKLTEEQMKEVKQKRRRNSVVLSMIQRGVTPSIFPKILRLKKAKEAWKVLKQEFQGDVKMKSYGDEFEDHRIVEKILISIPEKFDPIIGSQNFGRSRVHSNPACKATKDHNQIFEEGVHPEVAAEAKNLEAVDVDKVTEVLEDKAISTKNHLAMEPLTSVPFGRKTITKKKIVGTNESLYALTVINLVI
ncbi:hypothetical protein Tco_0340791 [Tanacetum coccineum]